MGLYSLGSGKTVAKDDETAVTEIIQEALRNPHRFVMKPQREGGGNNLYEAQIVHALSSFSPEKVATFILMDRIEYPSHSAVFVRDEQVSQVKGASELGVFSTFLCAEAANGKDDLILINESAGYLLRTKAAAVDDGGVAAGVALLDSPYLV